MRRACLTVAIACGLAVHPAGAHDGPPFPIAVDHAAGPYVFTVWTDPDTTDDGSPGGQFWVRLAMRDGQAVPEGTTATIDAAPTRSGVPATSVVTQPVRGDLTNQSGALVLDREGRFTIGVRVAGPAGATSLTTVVDATYDLRPPLVLLPLYLMPFALVGLLWTRLLLRRRRAADAATDGRLLPTFIHTRRPAHRS